MQSRGLPRWPLTCAPPSQDLDYLSEGLEGRCQSPVALLFDALLRPDTDFGGNTESVLTWKLQKERAIPHVVLGRNLPGGAWHVSGPGGVQGDLGRICTKSCGDSLPKSGLGLSHFPAFLLASPSSNPLPPLLLLLSHFPLPVSSGPMSSTPSGMGASRGLNPGTLFHTVH